MTREYILEIDAHCTACNISRAAYLRELGLSQNAYYNARRRHFGNLKEASNTPLAADLPIDQPQSGGFLPIQFTSETRRPPAAPPKRTRSQRKQDQELANGSMLLIEMRTSSGT